MSNPKEADEAEPQVARNAPSATAPVEWEDGHGATAADLRRGHLEIDIGDEAKHDLAAYKRRMSLPPDENPPSPAPEWLNDDERFALEGRHTTGFLTRPWPPNERN